MGYTIRPWNEEKDDDALTKIVIDAAFKSRSGGIERPRKNHHEQYAFVAVDENDRAFGFAALIRKAKGSDLELHAAVLDEYKKLRAGPHLIRKALETGIEAGVTRIEFTSHQKPEAVRRALERLTLPGMQIEHVPETHRNLRTIGKPPQFYRILVKPRA